jgi:hypothetical protein
MASPKSNVFRAIAPWSLLTIAACTGPLDRDCNARFADVDIPADWTVHTRLVFDYSQANDETARRLVTDGFQRSGRPSIIVASDTGSSWFLGVTSTPMINSILKEILIEGPSGQLTDVIVRACNMEQNDIWLQSISFRPYEPTESQVQEVLK